MSFHASALQVSRHTKRTLYVIAGFYVVVGFALAVASAVIGDRLGTFLGFLIISGAMVAATVVRAVLRIEVCVAAIAEGVDEVRRRVVLIETTTAALRERLERGAEREAASGAIRVLDLASIGAGDPSILAATTLDRRVYPRLVKTMESAPPAESADSVAPIEDASGAASHDHASGNGRDADHAPTEREWEANLGGGPAAKNLLRQWRVALRNGDLAECRSVASALIDTAGEDAVRPLLMQMETLADRVERALREAFASRVRENDFASALAVGERMCCLLPDRPVAEEVRRLAPLLTRRVVNTTGLTRSASE